MNIKSVGRFKYYIVLLFCYNVTEKYQLKMIDTSCRSEFKVDGGGGMQTTTDTDMQRPCQYQFVDELIMFPDNFNFK